MSTNEKIVITGSNGFVGNVLAKKLNSNIYSLRGIDNKSSNESCIETINCDLVTGSMNTLETICGNSTIVHLAALSNSNACENNPEQAFALNLGVVTRLVDIVNKSNGSLIFASSEWVYPNNITGAEQREDLKIEINSENNIYSVTKIAAEWYISRYCSRYDILRFGIIYGERETPQSAIESIVHDSIIKSEVALKSLETARRFIHVDDVTDGIKKLIEAESTNSIYNLSGNELVSLANIISTIEKISENKINVITSREIPSIRNPINNKFKEKFSWEPKISFEQGVINLYKYYLNRNSWK